MTKINGQKRNGWLNQMMPQTMPFAFSSLRTDVIIGKYDALIMLLS
jgi:hypothetical protein